MDTKSTTKHNIVLRCGAFRIQHSVSVSASAMADKDAFQNFRPHQIASRYQHNTQ